MCLPLRDCELEGLRSDPEAFSIHTGVPPPHAEGVKVSRPLVFAAAIAIIVGAAVLAGLVVRDRAGTATPTPITSAAPAETATPVAVSTTPATSAPSASPTPQAASGVLDDRFGFYIYSESAGPFAPLAKATVRSETSDTDVSSFASRGRSFTFLSRVVSPDGRLVAYWDPVDNGAVLSVRSVMGGSARAVLAGRPEMSGSAFAWSSDGTGLVVALDNNCFEFCSGRSAAELWTVDLASGATEKVAIGSFWIPVTWDRVAKLVAAGVTGPGGYLVAYDVIDLRQEPYPVRSTPFRPTVIGRLKASSDARYVLLAFDQGASSSLAWWPLAEPAKRTAVEFAASAAEWRPGTSEIWWVDGLTPPGCRTPPCRGTELVSFDVGTGARRMAVRGDFGATLVGFRVDGSATITQGVAFPRELVLVDMSTGQTASIPISGQFGGAVRLR